MTDNATPVALITGASRRIGRAIALQLHQRGANIIAHFNRSADDAEHLVDTLNGIRANSAAAIQGDITNIASITSSVEKAIEIWQRLDVLINNASTFYPTGLGQISEDQFNDLIGTNLKAPLFISQAAANTLATHKGCIINIVDIHAKRPLKNYPVYSVAKAGLMMLTMSLARELGPNVRVNGIAPGAILWPEAEENQMDENAILERIALKQRGSPEDIARTAEFLAFDAPYITGQIINVCGGRSLYQ